MLPVFEKNLLINGFSLHVRRFGHQGPHILFIHGGPDWDHSYFLPYVLQLAEEFQLTFFDLRGCGLSLKSGKAVDYSRELAVDDAAALIDQLGLIKPCVLGFSFGGGLALELARRYPEKVGQLILASSTAYTDFQNDLDQWDEYRSRKTGDLDAAIKSFFSRDGGKESDADRTRQLAHLTLCLDIWDVKHMDRAKKTIDNIRFSGEWLAAWRAGMLKSPEIKHDQALLASAIPTLILHGAKDMRFPVSVANRLKQAVPNAQLSILPDAGHLTHIEKPDMWNAAIRKFLA